MQRIDSPTSKEGRFVDGDPVRGVSATQLTAKWFNQIQEEVVNTIISAGLTPSDAENQMSLAIETLVSRASGGGEREGVISGVKSSLSDMPKFLRASSFENSVTVLASEANPLILQAGSRVATFNSQREITGLTLGPARGNTKAVNESDLTNDLHAGSVDYAFNNKSNSLAVDGTAAEFTSRVGTPIAVSFGTEIAKAFLKSETEMTDVKRGWAFDSGNNHIPAQGISDDDSVTLLSYNYLFYDFDTDGFFAYGLRLYEQASEPQGVADGIIWKNTSTGVFSIKESGAFVSKAFVIVGDGFCDTSKTAGVRCRDFFNSYSNENSAELEILSSTEVQTTSANNHISIYGTLLIFDSIFKASMTENLLSGLSESADTEYYLYLNKDRLLFFDIKRPHFREDLRGYYHQSEAWRCLAKVYNNSRLNLDANDGANAYIWEKYSPRGILKDLFVANFNTDGSISTDIGNIVQAANRRGSDYLITFKAGIFTSEPVRTLTSAGSSVNAFGSVWNASSNSLQVRTGNNAQHDYGLMISKNGNDYIQTQLDNRLK